MMARWRWHAHLNETPKEPKMCWIVEGILFRPANVVRCSINPRSGIRSSVESNFLADRRSFSLARKSHQWGISSSIKVAIVDVAWKEVTITDIVSRMSIPGTRKFCKRENNILNNLHKTAMLDDARIHAPIFTHRILLNMESCINLCFRCAIFQNIYLQENNCSIYHILSYISIDKILNDNKIIFANSYRVTCE